MCRVIHRLTPHKHKLLSNVAGHWVARIRGTRERTQLILMTSHASQWICFSISYQTLPIVGRTSGYARSASVCASNGAYQPIYGKHGAFKTINQMSLTPAIIVSYSCKYESIKFVCIELISILRFRGSGKFARFFVRSIRVFSVYRIRNISPHPSLSQCYLLNRINCMR